MDSRSEDTPKHTLGKWFADHWNDDNSQPIAIQSVWLDGVTFIGEIESSKMADAQLIAAAPEMLEALNALCSMKLDCPCELSNEQLAAWHKAYNAIAKAEGRQP